MPLKITKHSNGTWYITGTVAGQRIRESTGTAQRDVAEAVRIKREGELDRARIYGRESVATFAQAMNLYLDGGGDPTFLAKPLDMLGPTRLMDIDQMLLDKMAKTAYPDVMASTLNRQFYTPVIAVMTKAHKAGLCPLRLWDRPKGHAKRTRFRWLWPNEFEAFWNELHPEVKPICEFMAGTGARTSEALPLLWEDVSLQTGEAWLWETKNGDARKVDLPSRVVSSLSGLQNGEGVFSPRKSIKTAVRRASERAKLKEVTPHVMRHTFATWFYSATLDRQRLMALGGWKSDQVDRYCHVAPSGLKNELARHGWNFGGNDAEVLVRSL